MARSRDHDIKAPDGFLLGGLRRVRRDGTILFQRGWWQAPTEWRSQQVWVHCCDSGMGDLEAAPPGVHIYSAQAHGTAVLCSRTARPDAAETFRDPAIKAWIARSRTTTKEQTP